MPACWRLQKERMAKFKFNDIDVLAMDEIGKNISGNGHDPNVTGRNITRTFGDTLNLKKMFIRGITPEAHHNGCGIGCADVTTHRCLNDIDWGSNLDQRTDYRNHGRLPDSAVCQYR